MACAAPVARGALQRYRSSDALVAESPLCCESQHSLRDHGGSCTFCVVLVLCFSHNLFSFSNSALYVICPNPPAGMLCTTKASISRRICSEPPLFCKHQHSPGDCGGPYPFCVVLVLCFLLAIILFIVLNVLFHLYKSSGRHVVSCKGLILPAHLWPSYLCVANANICSVTTEVRALFVCSLVLCFLAICFLFQIEHSTSFVYILRPHVVHWKGTDLPTEPFLCREPQGIIDN